VGSVTGEATVGVSSYVYVTEREDRSIRMFPRAGNGDIEPARVIIGNSSGLVDPRHPVLDPVKNELFVLNSGAGSVVVFDAMASGDAVPLRTISALDADLTVAYGLAIDPVRREIYVGFNLDRRVVLVFGMDDAGPVEPRRQFSVDADNMYGVTLDPVHNELFVTTLSDIRVFSRTAEGTASPLRTISGDDTRLTGASPNQVALDLVHDEIIVPCSGTSAESVLVFPRDAEGDVPPRTSDGPGVPLGVAVDPVANEIFVADIAAGSLKVFDRTAEGNAVPLRTISGGQTGLSRPSSVYLP
jgi:DNA-binding beta-propeller fold protein YncE